MSAIGSRRLSIQTVLIACFLLVAAAPIAFISVQRYVWTTREHVREDLEGDLDLARAVAAGLDRFLRARVHFINTLAEELAERGLHDVSTLTKDLDIARRRHPAFRTFLIADREGVARVFSPPADEQGRPNVGRRYGDRAWFQGALKSPPEPSYDVVLGRAQGGRPTVAVAAPVRPGSGQVIGVVAGGVDLDELRQSVHVADRTHSVHLVVVDSGGRVVVHSSREWEAEARDLSSQEVFRTAQRLGEGTVQYVSLFSGDTRWGSYVKIPSTGWVVWVSRGPEALQPTIRSLVRDLLLSALVGIVIAAGAAMVAGHSLARPIHALANATREVAARRFQEADRLLPQRSSRIREFDQLLAGFREMAESVGAQYDELETKVAQRTRTLEDREREARATAALLRVQEEIQRGYGELAALLNSLDRSHVLQEGTKKIAASLHAPLAAVYLTEDGPAGLRLKTYAAVDAGGLDTSLLSPTGLPAEVVRRGEPVTVGLLEGSEPLRLQTGVGVVEVAAIAGWPLIWESRPVGALVVATLEPLAEHVRGFLDNAARQLSVALANAALYESIRYQSQQAEQLNAELQRASEVKSQFLASMSHELRTPLNAIIGFTDVLLMSARDPLSDRQRTALEKVRESGKHLLGLINDVLDLSKIESGRVDIRPERVGLASLINECLAAVEPQVQSKGLSLRAVGLEGAPELVQDRARVKQILLNLLANAVKFTPAGSVEVRVEPERDGMVAFAVADTGIGIRPEHLEAIFDEFRQVDSAEARAAGGTGLGLAISRRLARLLDGTLTVESVPGVGSTFTLLVPARLPAAEPPAASVVARRPALVPASRSSAAAQP